MKLNLEVRVAVTFGEGPGVAHGDEAMLFERGQILFRLDGVQT